jgi:hypothetical protein
MTPFHFLILCLILRVFVEVWFQGDLLVGLRARAEAMTRVEPIRTWSRLPYNLLTFYGGVYEAVVCEFCCAHHVGGVLATVGLFVMRPPTTLYAAFTTLFAGLCYGYAAGHLVWFLDRWLVPYELKYSRPRELLEELQHEPATQPDPAEDPGPTDDTGPAGSAAVLQPSEQPGPASPGSDPPG